MTRDSARRWRVVIVDDEPPARQTLSLLLRAHPDFEIVAQCAHGEEAIDAVLAQAPIVLRMQSSWPASDIFQEMAAQYVERVQAMSNNRIKIDLLPAGAVVGAFQVQDACHDGTIDGHGWFLSGRGVPRDVPRERATA